MPRLRSSKWLTLEDEHREDARWVLSAAGRGKGRRPALLEGQFDSFARDLAHLRLQYDAQRLVKVEDFSASHIERHLGRLLSAARKLRVDVDQYTAAGMPGWHYALMVAPQTQDRRRRRVEQIEAKLRLIEERKSASERHRGLAEQLGMLVGQQSAYDRIWNEGNEHDVISQLSALLTLISEWVEAALAIPRNGSSPDALHSLADLRITDVEPQHWLIQEGIPVLYEAYSGGRGIAGVTIGSPVVDFGLAVLERFQVKAHKTGRPFSADAVVALIKSGRVAQRLRRDRTR